MDAVRKGDRGQILVKDVNNTTYVLAGNRNIPFAYISPAEVEDPEAVVQFLRDTLSVPEEDIRADLSRTQSLFELVKKNLTDEQAGLLTATALKGVYTSDERMRVYPQGSMAAEVIGFVNQDENGQYGIEQEYEDELAGKVGVERTVRNPGGYFSSGVGNGPQDGQDIMLTLDYHVQAMAEDLLGKAVKNLHAKSGTMIVVDPKTGAVLALANAPSFDPNAYGKVSDLGVFQNGATQKIFEPGSIFKPITMAAAIQAGSITPDTTYEDKGFVTLSGKTVRNYDNRVWGTRTMTEVLEFSINTGAVFAEATMGHENFIRAAEAFRVFEPTRVDLPGEAYSENKEVKRGYDIGYATAAFGQGIEMAPMQIVRAYTALANKGVLSPIFITEEQGRKDAGLGIQVISADTASQVTNMLINVIEKGYSKVARIPGYYVAGKTGTAQISYSALGISKSGYSDKTVQSFIGYAPAFNPKFLILVKLDAPEAKTAEYSALPVFRDLAKYMLDYYQIPPDYEVK